MTARRVVRNSAYLFASRVVGIVCTVIVVAVAARYLGVNLFGFFALISAVAMVLHPLSDFGLEDILCREVVRRPLDASVFVSSVLLVRLGLFSLILGCSAAVLHWSTSWPADVKLGGCLLLAAELLMALTQNYLGVMRAQERMQYVLLVISFQRVVTTLAVVFAAWFDLGFFGLAAGRAITSFCSLLLAAQITYRRFVPFVARFDRKFAMYALREGFPLAIYVVLLALLFKTGVFFLQFMGTAQDVSFYESANRLVTQLQVIPMSIAAAVFPILARVGPARENEARMTTYYQLMGKFMFLAGLGCSVLLAVGSYPMMRVVCGPAFRGAGAALLALAPSAVFLFLVSLQHRFLVALNCQHINTWSILAALLINAASNVVLSPRLGHVGAGVAATFAYAGLCTSNSWFLARRGLRMRWSQAHGKALAMAVVCLAFAWVHLPAEWMTLAVRMILVGIVYCGGLLLGRVVTPDEWTLFRTSLRSRQARPPVGSAEEASQLQE